MTPGPQGATNNPRRMPPRGWRRSRRHPYRTTLLSLVQRVGRRAGSELEVVAIVTRLVNRGRVELIGSFKGERFE